MTSVMENTDLVVITSHDLSCGKHRLLVVITSHDLSHGKQDLVVIMSRDLSHGKQAVGGNYES